jgi:hypothetical protein
MRATIVDNEGAARIERQREFLRTDADLRGRHVKALRRRLDYLEASLEQDLREGARNFMMAERAALRWALDVVESAYPKGAA